MRVCACTIVAANYLAEARVLMGSLRDTNPGFDQKVLLVDRADARDARLHPDSFDFDLVEVESLGIEGFREMAFRYDMVELCTTVKPFWLQSILDEGYDAVVYLDPDILVFEPLDELVDWLAEQAIVVTPHITQPIEDDKRPDEQDHLLNGVFNLGFIGVANSEDGYSFLAWWQERCRTLGFEDVRSGLFVDQKWIDYLPCFFPNHHVVRDPAYNVAYWNLQERAVERRDDRWFVNGRSLVFFHFSGFPHGDLDVISKHQDRFTLAQYPALRPLMEEYRALLKHAGVEDFRQIPYAFSRYDSGETISRVARRYYSISRFEGDGDTPFSTNSGFYRWAKRRNIHASRPEAAEDYNYRTVDPKDPRLRMANRIMKVLRRLLGADRYYLLMKYFSYFAILRHQRNMLD